MSIKKRGLATLITLLLAAGGLIATGARTATGATQAPASDGPPATLAAEADIVQECDSTSGTAATVLAATCTSAAEQVGNAAFLYGIAPLEFVREAATQTSVNVPNALADEPVNQFGSDAQLNTPQPGHSVFVQPNVDTLYTMARLDLTATALVMHVPRITGHRYYVMQFLDPYTNTFAYVGTRTTGDGAHSFLITGPNWTGTVPRGMTEITSPYDLAWICGRTLVNGPADLPAVHAIQKQYRLIPLAKYRRYGLAWKPKVPRHKITVATSAQVPTGLAFYSALGAALAASPPPAADAPILADLAEAGIGLGRDPAVDDADPAVRQGLAEAADSGLANVSNDRTSEAGESALTNHGWFAPYADTGNFGTDYEWRAVVAVYGLGANEPAEAEYIVGVLDNHDTKLNAADDYTITFPADALPPAKYFWSLTMYDDNFSLVPNAIDRYALANHIPGLHYNADHSLTIYISHAQPPAAEVSNWLPAPASGNFEVTLRLYGPGANVLAGTYTYPSIERVAN
jgi:hypothetical protein